MGYFLWYPNFYLIFVAPPGVVNKTTTINIGMSLLRRVPGVKFGPEAVTWQALIGAFEEATETFKINGTHYIQSAMTIESSEFGNLIDPSNQEQIDFFISMFDCKLGSFQKVTKGSGANSVENPYINLLSCTTPAWIAGNFPEHAIGGGFASRCLFVYAEEKEKYVAYPARHMPKELHEIQQALVQDLEHIGTQIMGPYAIDPAAENWGEEFYLKHWKGSLTDELSDDRFASYLARKQMHLHKTAICIAASTRDERILLKEDLEMAFQVLLDLEHDMPKVFARIGRTNTSVQAERFIMFVQRKGRVSYAEAYQFIHSAFPSAKNFEDIVIGAKKAGYIDVVRVQGGYDLVSLRKHP